MPEPNDVVAEVLGDEKPPEGTPPPAESKPPEPEGKPILDAEGKPVLDKDGKPTYEKPAEKPQGAPEKYEAFKLPEGATINQELLDQFTPLAKELNLSQDQAQKLVDLYNTNALGSIAKVQQEAWQKLKSSWLEEAKKDPVIGGSDFQAKCKVGMKAIQKYGDQDLATLITGLGIGQNPAFIRFCYKVGAAVAEDKMVSGGAEGVTPKAEENLFPTMFKK